MKRRCAVGILCSCVLLSAAGCSPDAEVKTQPESSIETIDLSEYENQEHYEELIAAVEGCLLKKDVVIPADYDFSSALIASGYYEDGVRGYLIEDMDGDGVEELVLGENGTDSYGVRGSIVYDIYTISDGELVHVLNGWVRNRYYICENGMIANEGSSGAGNSSYSYHTFEGSELQLAEAVICDGMKDAEHPWFYSTESEFDTENAEPISEERAAEIREKYIYESPVFIPFIEKD